MSYKNVNGSGEDYMDFDFSFASGKSETGKEEELPGVYEGTVDDSINELEGRLEKLKNDVKNLKKIKKQQEKLGKLEEKKLEILREIEREQHREKKLKSRHNRKKR